MQCVRVEFAENQTIIAVIIVITVITVNDKRAITTTGAVVLFVRPETRWRRRRGYGRRYTVWTRLRKTYQLTGTLSAEEKRLANP